LRPPRPPVALRPGVRLLNPRPVIEADDRHLPAGAHAFGLLAAGSLRAARSRPAITPVRPLAAGKIAAVVDRIGGLRVDVAGAAHGAGLLGSAAAGQAVGQCRDLVLD